jgi:hypothetical protein
MMYRYAYNVVVNETFVDENINAVSFSTRVEAVGEIGSQSEYVLITMRRRQVSLIGDVDRWIQLTST